MMDSFHVIYNFCEELFVDSRVAAEEAVAPTMHMTVEEFRKSLKELGSCLLVAHDKPEQFIK